MIRDRLVDIIRNEGFDFFTAHELANRCIAEFKASNKKKATYYIGKASFVIARKS